MPSLLLEVLGGLLPGILFASRIAPLLVDRLDSNGAALASPLSRHSSLKFSL